MVVTPYNGPFCPTCGSVDPALRLTKETPRGVLRCGNDAFHGES